MYGGVSLVEGTHFYKLEGQALRDFKNCISDPDAVPKRTRNLTLWTERGAARHAKMLDTEADFSRTPVKGVCRTDTPFDLSAKPP